ncbi:DMT family transporter [Devosia sp.]|uniref:DMT family transporter n=1 Tax=Devosia sp. TaxID=1871048 RepID=UPI003A8FF110
MTNAPGAPSDRASSGLFSQPYLILTLTSMFWGGNVVASKLAVGHIDPYALMLLRWVGAVLLILPFALKPLRRDWPAMRPRWWLYLFYGVVGFATFNALLYFAAHHTSGVNMALEQVAVNIFVLAISFVLFRTRVKPLQLFGIALTILGVALIASAGDLTRLAALKINIGDGMVVLASLAYAIYTVATRWKPPAHWLSFFVAAGTGGIIGSLFYIAISAHGLTALPALVTSIDQQGWLIVLYTVLFPSIGSQILFVRGIELIGANRASLFVNLIPLFGAVFSVLILGEQPQGYHLVAAALIAIGIVLAEWVARRV